MPGIKPDAAPRVCVLTSVHKPFDIRIFQKEGRTLARSGYQVTIVVPHDHDVLAGGLQIKAVAQPAGRLERMTRTVLAVCLQALRQDADIYHFHDPELIGLGLLLRLRGKKVIYDVHEDNPSEVRTKHYLPRPLRRPLAWITEQTENLSSRYLSAIISATPAIHERFSLLTRPSIVVRNFPRLEESVAVPGKPWPERGCTVAYVGSFSARRGLKQAVQAMALLPRSLPATLTVAGTFEPPSLQQEISAVEGWHRVRMLGLLKREQVAEVLADARAGLVLFQPHPNHLRAEPNKLFEYMSAGLPVIASDFPGFRRVVEEIGCGLLVDPQDPRGIAGAIQYLLTHPQEAEEMGNRGRQMVQERYNWAHEEGKLLQLYRTLHDQPLPAPSALATAAECGSDK